MRASSHESNIGENNLKKVKRNQTKVATVAPNSPTLCPQPEGVSAPRQNQTFARPHYAVLEVLRSPSHRGVLHWEAIQDSTRPEVEHARKRNASSLYENSLFGWTSKRATGDYAEGTEEILLGGQVINIRMATNIKRSMGLRYVPFGGQSSYSSYLYMDN